MACGEGAVLSMSAVEVGLLCSALLDSRATNVPKAIRTAAASALDQAVSATSESLLTLLVPALAAKAAHKNRDVAEQVYLNE